MRRHLLRDRTALAHVTVIHYHCHVTTASVCSRTEAHPSCRLKPPTVRGFAFGLNQLITKPLQVSTFAHNMTGLVEGREKKKQKKSGCFKTLRWGSEWRRNLGSQKQAYVEGEPSEQVGAPSRMNEQRALLGPLVRLGVRTQPPSRLLHWVIK